MLSWGKDRNLSIDFCCHDFLQKNKTTQAFEKTSSLSNRQEILLQNGSVSKFAVILGTFNNLKHEPRFPNFKQN